MIRPGVAVLNAGTADYAHARGRVNYPKTKNQKTKNEPTEKIPLFVLCARLLPAAAEYALLA
jgi:hypothetical protein